MTHNDLILNYFQGFDPIFFQYDIQALQISSDYCVSPQLCVWCCDCTIAIVHCTEWCAYCDCYLL